MASDRQFRNVSWGMTKNEVKSAERNATFVGDDEASLFYEGTIVGCDAFIYYKFVNDKLDGGGYLIDNEHDVSDVTAYEKLQELMEKKYGEPESKGLEQKYPSKKLRIDTYGDLANAIASGMAKLKCVWRTDESIIILVCDEDTEKHNVTVHAIYKDISTMQDNSEETYDRDIDNV